jgi:hypothetical protein
VFFDRQYLEPWTFSQPQRHFLAIFKHFEKTLKSLVFLGGRFTGVAD